MYYDPRTDHHGLAHDPITALVVPRPIGWISTIAPDGLVNLAPYSFFNLVAGRPHPFVMFCSNPRKDSQRNAETSGEFVVNVATFDLREKMNLTSAVSGPHQSEPELADLRMVACRAVAPPRVAASPIALECRYSQTVALQRSSGQATNSSIIIGEVIGIHISDDVITDGLVDITKVRPVARLGYMDYTVVDEVFTMPRPADYPA